MIKVKYYSKKHDGIVTNEYDYQNYVKPVYCSCCDTMIHNNTIVFHNKTEFHRIAQHLRNINTEPIDDIKKKVLEYKMVQKFMKKTFNNNDSSTNSENHEEDVKQIDEMTLNRIKRKSESYKRELDYRAKKYERTKGISMLVNTIKTTTKRLTNLQIERYNDYLIKYPENELLLSVQCIVRTQEQALKSPVVPKN